MFYVLTNLGPWTTVQKTILLINKSSFLWDSRRYGSCDLAKEISAGKQTLCLCSQELLPAHPNTHISSPILTEFSLFSSVISLLLTCLRSISALLDFESMTISLAFF